MTSKTSHVPQPAVDLVTSDERIGPTIELFD